jgi:hypothetical protein
MSKATIPPSNIKGATERAVDFWRGHRRGLILFRVTIASLVATVVVYIVGQAGLLGHLDPWGVYGAVLGTVDPVITVVSLLQGRVRLRMVIPPDDPGHYDLPYLPEGTELAPGLQLIRIPSEDVPGTYLPGRPPEAPTRFAYQWTRRVDERPLRFFEFKLGVVGIRADRNDAKECVAHAELTPIQGEGETLRLGRPQPIGRLSWYSAAKIHQLTEDARDERGLTYFPGFDRIFESPTRGLNAFLSNSEMTIREGETAYLILFYLRSDFNRVFIGGELEGENLGPSSVERPVEFEVKIQFKALSAHLDKRVRCTARWDLLTIREVE